MLFFQFQSIIYRHAMSFHTENHLSLGSVLPTVLLLAWLVHWESPAW